MNWKIVDKSTRIQPHKGVYSDWKEQIASDCSYQCVYCSIHEGQFGGINNFHIDHFRPKSIFNHLENDIYNLYYSCPICNRFKSNDWPNEPNLHSISYPDPSEIDFSGIFQTTPDSQIVGKYLASKYIIIRLYLNRPQLIFERREYKNTRKVSELINQISGLINENGDKINALEAYKTLNQIQTKIRELVEQRKFIRPYELKDIKRNNG